MGFTSFRDLLIEELSDIYDAENQIVKSLPKLQNSASSVELKEAIGDHLKQTKNQVTRLKKIFKHLKTNIKEKKCSAMQGLLKEADEIIKIKNKSSLKDAALIGAAQKVEHYEIAAYGTAKSHAKLLGLKEVVALLEETEDEEAAADQKLTKIAEGSFFSKGVNSIALETEENKNEKQTPKKSDSKTAPKKTVRNLSSHTNKSNNSKKTAKTSASHTNKNNKANNTSESLMKHSHPTSKSKKTTKTIKHK